MNNAWTHKHSKIVRNDNFFYHWDWMPHEGHDAYNVKVGLKFDVHMLKWQLTIPFLHEYNISPPRNWTIIFKFPTSSELTIYPNHKLQIDDKAENIR